MIPTVTNPMGISLYSRRLQYLASTGTQYIDTGIKPQEGFAAEVRFLVPSDGLFSCGARAGGVKNIRITANPNYTDYAFGPTFQRISESNLTEHTVKICADGRFYRDGVLVYSGSGEYTTDYNFYLFALNQPGDPVGMGKGKLFSAILTVNDTVVENLFPALFRGVPCMYDTVSRTFKYNAGTGTFNYA